MTVLVPYPEGSKEGEEGPPGEGRDRLQALVLDSVSSQHSRRAYKKALDDFLAFLGPRPFTRASLQEFRSHLESSGLAPASINLRLAPLRKLATEAAENGWMDPTVAAGIARVRGVRRLGLRVGKWATAEEATALLQAPDASTVKGKRDRAILATLIGCALRRGELVGLTVADLQERDGRAVFVDISGKGGRIRTVPVPDWVETALQAWLQAAGITEARIFRAVSRWGSVVGERLSTTAVLGIVAEYTSVCSSRPTTSAARAPNSAGSPAGPSSRFSFSWDTPPSRRPNATWEGSRSFRWRSMTSWAWDYPKPGGG